MSRRAWVIWAVLLGVCCVGLACAESSRYRVLTFFFEGVPKPGAKAVAESADSEDVGQEAPRESGELATPSAKQQVAVVPAIRVHPPYTQFRCGACHDGEAGAVQRTPQEGLCRQCHDVTAGLDYVHGPVAVSDCLFCHHHHGGKFVKMLRMKPNDVCLRCHDGNDLAGGEYHDGIEEQTCIDCHDGHGGNNRFFLKADRP